MALLLDIAGLILCIWALRKIAKIDRGDKEESRVSKKRYSSSVDSISKITKKPSVEKPAYNLFPKVFKDYYFLFEREVELINPTMDKLIGNSGKQIVFYLEDTTGEWSVLLDDELVGIIPDGEHIQKMVEWDTAEKEFCGYINKVDKGNSKATIKIGFYDDVNSLLITTFKLIRITKKVTMDGELDECRHQHMEWVKDGDLVDHVENQENEDAENYIIEDWIGNDLGELKTEDSNWVYENEDNIKFMKIVNIKLTESERYTADIDVYYSKE